MRTLSFGLTHKPNQLDRATMATSNPDLKADDNKTTFKMFVPNLEAFEEAEAVRNLKIELKQTQQTIKDDQKKIPIDAELQIISDSIQNHPGVQHNEPDTLKELYSVCSPNGDTPIWHVTFSKAVSNRAFQLACLIYGKEVGFYMDDAQFDPLGYRISDDANTKHHCIIWKRAKRQNPFSLD